MARAAPEEIAKMFASMTGLDLLDEDVEPVESSMLPKPHSRSTGRSDQTTGEQEQHQSGGPSHFRRPRDKAGFADLIDLDYAKSYECSQEDSDDSAIVSDDEDWEFADMPNGDDSDTSERLQDWEVIDRHIVDPDTNSNMKIPSIVQVDESYREVLAAYIRKHKPTEAQTKEAKAALSVLYFVGKEGATIIKDSMHDWADMVITERFDIDIDELPIYAAAALDQFRRRVPRPARRLAAAVSSTVVKSIKGLRRQGFYEAPPKVEAPKPEAPNEREEYEAGDEDDEEAIRNEQDEEDLLG